MWKCNDAERSISISSPTENYFMKHTIIAAVTTAAIFTVSHCSAQQSRMGCVDKIIAQRTETAIAPLEKQGMKVFKTASISMVSGETFPIEVQLKEGKHYEILFLGDEESEKITAELDNSRNKILAEKKVSRGADPSYISIDFTPEKSDVYLLMVSQKQKHNRNMCGNVTILEAK